MLDLLWRYCSRGNLHYSHIIMEMPHKLPPQAPFPRQSRTSISVINIHSPRIFRGNDSGYTLSIVTGESDLRLSASSLPKKNTPEEKICYTKSFLFQNELVRSLDKLICCEIQDPIHPRTHFPACPHMTIARLIPANSNRSFPPIKQAG